MLLFFWVKSFWKLLIFKVDKSNVSIQWIRWQSNSCVHWKKKTEQMVEEKETIPSFWRRLYWWADPLWTWGPAVSRDCWPGSCSAIGPKKGKKSETASHSTWIHICACPVFWICGHDPAWSIFTGSKPCSDCVGVHGFPNVSVHVSDELSI